ncbi:uncharacterized protein LOC113465011 [Ceratina calcarata]|uniref:Uncharacterized protein LOC113465011 n=1 Tax=Ceratina calcarata TaxID=156304 RepID=A0AAJ7S9M9_9HYME|nr:uncharacterized protein LOC113465011 [Ceratina calcarata]
MKTIITLLCAALLITCVFADSEEYCELNHKNVTAGVYSVNCVRYKCDPPNLSALACPVYICEEGQQIGEKQNDLTKPYPECCGGPICKKDE